ncbi:MAG: ribonuclease J [Actinomycetota bacterium]
MAFLGGLGEIGRNMACLEMDGRLLVIDCGLSFPHEGMPGIDLVLPDFEFLRRRSDRVDAVVLTHGHEDHIGALPYLLREMPAVVYGTALTLALLEGKLDEHGVRDRVELREIVPGEEAAAGPFRMRFLRVTHSIPDGVAVAVDTPYGTVLHTGDFKLDQTPLDSRATDLRALGEEGRRGVHLLLSDSTNAEDTGYVRSERTVGPVLRELVARAPRLVILSCFASHIHRIQQAADAARADHRMIAFLGRSMHQSVAAARRIGYLDVPEENVIPIEDLGRHDPRHVVVISTGSQGEPLSALSLMAAGEHKFVKLQRDDTVILSSSLIPGNEPAIHRVIDGLYRMGAEVHSVATAPVHVSGHAGADELKFVLALVRPRWFVPVHGEYRHLSHHSRLAREVGVDADHVLIAQDGDTIEIAEECRFGARIPAGVTLVDGIGIGDVGPVVLRDRRRMAADGILFVVVAIDQHHGDLVGGPDLVNRGVVDEEASPDVLERARELVMLSLKESAAQEVTDPLVLQQNVRSTLRKFFWQQTKRKPAVVPVILEV